MCLIILVTLLLHFTGILWPATLSGHRVEQFCPTYEGVGVGYVSRYCNGSGIWITDKTSKCMDIANYELVFSKLVDLLVGILFIA